jgi:hypothetical protein
MLDRPADLLVADAGIAGRSLTGTRRVDRWAQGVFGLAGRSKQGMHLSRRRPQRRGTSSSFRDRVAGLARSRMRRPSQRPQTSDPWAAKAEFANPLDGFPRSGIRTNPRFESASTRSALAAVHSPTARSWSSSVNTKLPDSAFECVTSPG